MQGGESGAIHKIPAPRRHNRLELMSPPQPLVIMRRVTYSWSADIFNCISHNRYMLMRTAAASHPWPGYFLCVFRDNKKPRIYLGNGWLAAPDAIFGHTSGAVPSLTTCIEIRLRFLSITKRAAIQIHKFRILCRHSGAKNKKLLT